MNNVNFIKGIIVLSKNITDDQREDLNLTTDNNSILFGSESWEIDKYDKKLLDELGWIIKDGYWSFYMQEQSNKLNQDTFNLFLKLVSENTNSKLRKGQLHMVILHSVSPSLYNEVCLGDFDCFYDDSKIEKFLKYIVE